jgi:hypothetical protein
MTGWYWLISALSNEKRSLPFFVCKKNRKNNFVPIIWVHPLIIIRYGLEKQILKLIIYFGWLVIWCAVYAFPTKKTNNITSA